MGRLNSILRALRADPGSDRDKRNIAQTKRETARYLWEIAENSGSEPLRELAREEERTAAMIENAYEDAAMEVFGGG